MGEKEECKMLEENKKKQQSGFSVMNTDELYEINGGDGGFEPTEPSKSLNGGPIQGPSVSASFK